MIFGFHCRNLLQFIQRLTWKYFLVLFVFSTQKQRSPVDQIQCEENCCTIAVGCRGSLCTMFFVYCFTEFFFLTHTHRLTHSLFLFSDTHTHTVIAEVYSSLAENRFCNSLELGQREQCSTSVGGSSQSAFPSVGSHYADRMTYKTACFCKTTSCVVYTPLKPISLERGRAASVLHISVSGSPVLQLQDSQGCLNSFHGPLDRF